MKTHALKIRGLLLKLCILLTTGLTAQAGIGTVTPQTALHIDVGTSTTDGITIENSSFSTEILSQSDSGNSNSIFNNTQNLGNFLIEFDDDTRYRIDRTGIYPSVNAVNNTVTDALDIGRFDLHFRRVYSQAIHTNDDTVDGGLGINIGSSGGVTSDYNFSDFAFYPVVSQLKDLGRNGNFWNNFYFVSAFVPSDSRLKNNIQPIDYGLSTLMRLKVYQYNYDFDQKHQTHFGFMAQQLQQLIPELVQQADNPERSLSINYTELTPLIVKALQQQQELIQDQGQKITELEAAIAQLNQQRTIQKSE